MAKGFHDSRYRELVGKLAQARRDQGLSQLQLAERIGQHQQFISKVEIGERRLDIVEFVDLAIALGLQPSALIASLER